MPFRDIFHKYLGVDPDIFSCGATLYTVVSVCVSVCLFVCEIQGYQSLNRSVVSLAQLVPPSVALPAELAYKI